MIKKIITKKLYVYNYFATFIVKYVKTISKELSILSR